MTTPTNPSSTPELQAVLTTSDFLDLVYQALRTQKHPLFQTISHDGDHKSSELIVETKDGYAFVITSSRVQCDRTESADIITV